MSGEETITSELFGKDAAGGAVYRTGHKLEFIKKDAVPVFADAGLPQFRPELREYRAKELLALEYFDWYARQQSGFVRSVRETASNDELEHQ